MGEIKLQHMNGGIGETSYANNSFLQQAGILMTKPVTERAITNLCTKIHPTCISIADLGCSSGPNTLLVTSEIIEAIDCACRKLGIHQGPEAHVFLNDLHGNDFNTLFKFMPEFQERLSKGRESGCYFTATPGSFHCRLFPAESLHLIHSSYCLHWISRIPKGIIGSNKGNTYISRTSPPSVVNAYYDQFREDFSCFLKHRSVEMVAGGCMVLSLIGRESEDPSSQDGTLVWDLLTKALNDAVSEGELEEEKVNTFNIPSYFPCPKEIESLVKEEGSFIIDNLETSQLHWSTASARRAHDDEAAIDEDAFSFMMCIRSVAEQMLLDHFHDDDEEGMMMNFDGVFHKYHKNVADFMARDREKAAFINVVVSMHKKTNI